MSMLACEGVEDRASTRRQRRPDATRKAEGRGQKSGAHHVAQSGEHDLLTQEAEVEFVAFPPVAVVRRSGPVREVGFVSCGVYRSGSERIGMRCHRWSTREQMAAGVESRRWGEARSRCDEAGQFVANSAKGGAAARDSVRSS